MAIPKIVMLTSAGGNLIGWAKKKFSQLEKTRLSLGLPLLHYRYNIGAGTVYIKTSEFVNKILISAGEVPLITGFAIERAVYGSDPDDIRVYMLQPNPDYDAEDDPLLPEEIWVEVTYPTDYDKGYGLEEFDTYCDWQGDYDEDGDPQSTLVWAVGGFGFPTRYAYLAIYRDIVYVAGKQFAIAPGYVVGAAKRVIGEETFLVVMCREIKVLKAYTRPFTSTTSADIYDEETAPDGWKLIFTGSDVGFDPESSYSRSGSVLFNESGTAAVLHQDLGYSRHWIRFVFDVDLWTYSVDVIGVNHLTNTLVTKTVAAVKADGGKWYPTWLSSLDTTTHSSSFTTSLSQIDEDDEFNEPFDYVNSFAEDVTTDKYSTSVYISAVEYVGDNLRICFGVYYVRFVTSSDNHFLRPSGIFYPSNTSSDWGEHVSDFYQEQTTRSTSYVFEEGQALITLEDTGEVKKVWELDATLDYSGGRDTDPGDVTVSFSITADDGGVSGIRTMDLRDRFYLYDYSSHLGVSTTTVQWSAYRDLDAVSVADGGTGIDYGQALASVLIPGKVDTQVNHHRGVRTILTLEVPSDLYVNEEMISAPNAWDFAMVDTPAGFYLDGTTYVDLVYVPRIMNPSYRVIIYTDSDRLTIPNGTFYQDHRGSMSYHAALSRGEGVFVAPQARKTAAISIPQRGFFEIPYTEAEMNYSDPEGLLAVTGDIPEGAEGAMLRTLGRITIKEADIVPTTP